MDHNTLVQAEMDFINMGLLSTDLTLSAFDWYILTSSNAKRLLMRLYNSGALLVEGLLTASAGRTVTGNLNVTGQITSASSPNMEVLQYDLTGNSSSATETMTLQHNFTNTTIYYGTNGSSGTYNALSSSTNLEYAIIISNRASSSFVW